MSDSDKTLPPPAAPSPPPRLPPPAPGLPAETPRQDFWPRLLMILLAVACALVPVTAGAPGWLAAGRVAVLALGAIVAALALAGFARDPRCQAGLLASLPLLPALAVTCAVVTFLIRPAYCMAPVASAVFALLVWLSVTDLGWGLPTPQRCNQSSYGELQHRLTQLNARLTEARAIANAEPDPETRQVMITACDQAQEQSEKLTAELNQSGGLPWVLGTGYISLWQRLHRAEEALIEVLPERTVIAAALYDELRLVGSRIDNRDDLLAKLRHGIVALDPCAMDFLKLSADEAKALTPATPGPNDPCPAKRRLAARSVLRMVRRALNDYRDSRYHGLVVSRNRTWGLTILTGLAMFLIVGLAMLSQAPAESIVAGLTFYLVGATVGLLDRLRRASEEEGAVADYGLSSARLASTPVFCGLAAVGGVLLVATLPNATALLSKAFGNAASRPQTVAISTNTNHVVIATNHASQPPVNPPSATPTNGSGPSPAPAPEAEQKTAPTLVAVFNLKEDLAGILIAAIFGLTPGLLFNRLQQQAEKFKAEIKTSEASPGSS